MSEERNVLLTAEIFSERVLVRSKEYGESILESLTSITEELDLEEEVVKKLVTAPLYSRLEAECNDSRLLKTYTRSKKLTLL